MTPGAAIETLPRLDRPPLVSLLAILNGIGAGLAFGVALLVTAFGGDDTWTAAVVSGIVGGLAALQVWCAIGLWTLKPYGRIVQLVFASVGLLIIPIGTVISVLLLVYLLKPGVRTLFSGKKPAELSDPERHLIEAVRQSPLATAIFVITLLGGGLTMVGIIAAIAIPGVFRARLAGNEAAAIGAIRTVYSAQATFASSCGGGFYSPSLALLGTPPASGDGEPFVAGDIATPPSIHSGYRIALTPGPVVSGSPSSCNGAEARSLVAQFFVSATPVSPGVTGLRYFGGDSRGQIYSSENPMAPTFDGAPIGAVPLEN